MQNIDHITAAIIVISIKMIWVRILWSESGFSAGDFGADRVFLLLVSASEASAIISSAQTQPLVFSEKEIHDYKHTKISMPKE